MCAACGVAEVDIDRDEHTDDGVVCGSCLEERGVCGGCNGSGEGMHEGARCGSCGGSGSGRSYADGSVEDDRASYYEWRWESRRDEEFDGGAL